MRYVFFGTPRFAEIVLRKLLDAGMPPVALVCNPDRPVGRKKIVTSPPTKTLATNNRTPIEILQPEKLDEAFMEQLQTLRPDFFVVAAYAKIIPKAVLAIPRLGTLGVHPSLLPKYRGASPIQSVILNGERETGVTIYAMD
jgi:methionyl-tRNA formyltransferase